MPTKTDKPNVLNAAPVTTNSILLAEQGNTRYIISLAQGAIPAEQTAAKELSSYLEQITGAKFIVKDELQVDENTPQILVGTGQRVRQLLPQQEWDKLGIDGILIKTVGQNLILSGSRPRGSLYAVYSFLEDQLGVRWWTPDETKIPETKTLRVPSLNVTYAPQLQSRDAFYVSSVHRDPHFATRLKLNGHFQKQGPELGGHNSILGWCHTFIQLLPPEKYFEKHPEWYSDHKNGNKPCTSASPMPVGHEWQICLSNEEARKELTKNALEWIKANPEAGMISITQNDSHNAHCTCEADAALEKADGSPSGPLIHFVNKVAADIEKEYPNFLVETLAYGYTQTPPLHVKPRHNVVIRLCSAVMNTTEPLDSEANTTFRNDIRRWKEISPQLYTWHYVTNYFNYLVPHPNLHAYGDDIRFLTQNKTIALFAQGDSSNEAGDFTGLRVWLHSHLMWNPALDQRQLESEYLNGYFGAAAPHLREYLDIIQKSGRGHNLSMYVDVYPYLTLDVMNSATLAFRAAELAVKCDSILARRVKRERLALDHAWIIRYYALKREASKAGKPFEGPTDIVVFVDEYARNAADLKIVSYSEGTAFETYMARVKARFAPNPPLPDSIPVTPESEILDIQEASFQLHAQGASTSIVDDAGASNGKAAKLLSNSFGWNAQYRLRLEDGEYVHSGDWRCYIVARVEPVAGTPAEGTAMVAGILDTGLLTDKVEKDVATITKSVAETADNQYRVFDLGKRALSKDCYFWIATSNNPSISALYIDRIVLVREP